MADPDTSMPFVRALQALLGRHPPERAQEQAAVHGLALVYQGESDVLGRHLAQVPAARVQQLPALRILRALCQLPDAPARALDQLGQLDHTALTPTLRAWFDLELAHAQALTVAPEHVDATLLSQTRLPDWLMCRREICRLACELALDVPQPVLPSAYRTLSACQRARAWPAYVLLARLLAHTLARLGDASVGLRLLDRARILAGQVGLSARCCAWLDGSRGQLLAQVGEPTRAEMSVRLALCAAEACGETALLRTLRQTLARVLLMQGHPTQARRLLTAEGNDVERVEMLGLLLREDSFLADAQRCAQQINWVQLETRSEDARAGAHVLRGLLHKHGRAPQRARTHFEHALRSYEHLHRPHLKAGVELLLAELALDAGEHARCKALLRGALGALEKGGYADTEWWQGEAMGRLLAFALAHKCAHLEATWLALRRLDGTRLNVMFALLGHADDEVRRCVQSLLEAREDVIQRAAREALAQCPDAHIAQHLALWLAQGWLRPAGLVALLQIVHGWRQIQCLLMWVLPGCDGRPSVIQRELRHMGAVVSLAWIKEALATARGALLRALPGWGSMDSPMRVNQALISERWIDPYHTPLPASG